MTLEWNVDGTKGRESLGISECSLRRRRKIRRRRQGGQRIVTEKKNIWDEGYLLYNRKDLNIKTETVCREDIWIDGKRRSMISNDL